MISKDWLLLCTNNITQPNYCFKFLTGCKSTYRSVKEEDRNSTHKGGSRDKRPQDYTQASTDL